jgi:hypothetical protein
VLKSDPQYYRKYKQKEESNPFFETQVDNPEEEANDQNLSEEKEEEMIKSKKFIYIISKLITYEAPVKDNEIYITIIKIYIELSKIDLLTHLVKEKEFLRMFMKYSLDALFNMFSNSDEKHEDDFHLYTSKII